MIASKLNSDIGLTFIAICNTFCNSAFKTKRYTNGEECFGGRYFIAGVHTDNGMCTHIFPMANWDLFKCKEVERLPDDGEYYVNDRHEVNWDEWKNTMPSKFCNNKGV